MAVDFLGTFETGQVNASGDTTDGYLIQTLSGSAYVGLTSGGAGPSSGYDTRVVASEVLGGEVITPRSGSYFVRSEIYFGKDYSVMPFNGGRNAPRSTIAISEPSLRVPFDTEKFIGFSIRVPSNYWHETGIKDNRGGVQLLSVFPGADTNATQFTILQYVKSPNAAARWYLWIHTDATSITESVGARVEYDLGEVAPDIGKWVDFVIRYRINPFSVDTNPSGSISGSKDQLFSGNNGIFQLWKGTGAVDGLGNRTMSLLVNLENEPVGLVPKQTDELQNSFRVYKYGWHTNPTASTEPVWFGFDAIRIGDSFAEVAPSQLELNPATAQITAMNAGLALDQSDPEINFSGTNINIAISGLVSDGTNTQALPWVVTDMAGLTGGKFSTGDLSALTSPNINVIFNVMTPSSSTTNFSTWTTLFARKTTLAGGIWTFTDGTTVAGGTTPGGTTYAYSCVESPDEAITSGDTITVRWIYKPGTSAKVDLRVVSGASYIRIYNEPSSPSISQSGIGTDVSFTNQALSDTGAYLVTLTFTASSSINIRKRIGIGVATPDATVHALMCTTFYNESSSASQVSFATTASITDLTAPTLSSLNFTSTDGESGAISVTTDEAIGDGWAVVTNSSTAPTQERIRTGLDHDGNAAMWGGYSPVSSETITWSPTGLPKASDKYAHVYHVDGSNNESSVLTSSVVAGDTTVKSIKFDSTHGRMKRGGALFSGTFGNLKIYSELPWKDPAATLLAHAQEVVSTSGEVTVIEADIEPGGSINALEAATDYAFVAYDDDNDPFAFGYIQITVE